MNYKHKKETIKGSYVCEKKFFTIKLLKYQIERNHCACLTNTHIWVGFPRKNHCTC